MGRIDEQREPGPRMEVAPDERDPAGQPTVVVGLPTDQPRFGAVPASLAQDPAYEAFAPEIRKLQALGLAVQESPTQLATDVRLVVGSEASAAPSGDQNPTPKD